MFAFSANAGAAISAGNTGWNWANPLPQGNSLGRVEVSGGRLWAGGATGTLLHSDDGGSTWSAVRTGLLDDIRTIDAISPFSVVFAGRCALRRSDDSGLTVRRLAWGSNDDSCTAQIQAVSFASPLLGYLLLTNGDVYTTGDGGDSWRKQSVVPGSTALGGADAVRDLVFTSPSTGVVSVGNRILQSADAGVSWTPVKTVAGGAGLVNFDFVSGLVGFAAGDHTDLLKTTDGGITWNAVAGDGSINAQSIVDLACADATRCVATTSTGVALLTTDGGATWTAQELGGAVRSTVFLDASHAIGVGADGLIALSSNGGSLWGPVFLSNPGKLARVRADSSTRAVAFGSGGEFARSDDGGGRWSPGIVRGAKDIVDATSLGGGRLLALDSSAKLFSSTDSGSTWKQQASWARQKPRAVFAWSAKRVALIGPAGVQLSTRGGAGARRAGGKGAKLTFTSVDRARGAVFAYGGRDIAVSTNKGKTWSRVARPRGVRAPFQLDMVDAKNGYVLDANAELFATRNGGRRWTRLETTGANAAVSMAFSDRKHGYLTDNTGRILATSDAGATWARQYPFYDSTEKSPTYVAATSKLGAIALVGGTNKLFVTSTLGRIGRSSTLTIKPSATKVRSGTVVRVTGKLSPATGIEQVTVLARVVGAKGGTKWVSQQRPVSATGTFSSPWKITATTEFIARWSGDASHDGDAAPIKIVKLRK